MDAKTHARREARAKIFKAMAHPTPLCSKTLSRTTDGTFPIFNADSRTILSSGGMRGNGAQVDRATCSRVLTPCDGRAVRRHRAYADFRSYCFKSPPSHS